MKPLASVLLVFGLLLTACAPQTTAEVSPTSSPAETPPASAAPPPATSATLEPQVQPSPAAPQPPRPVTIPGAKGLALRGTYYTPPAGPAPAVLLLHMYGRTRADWEAFARSLQEQGVAALALDLRGHGETDGAEDWELARQDTLLAREWLAQQQEVDAARTAVVGASIGANLALWTAALSPEVRAVAALSPGFDYFRVRIEGVMEQYGPRPAFLAASEDDSYSAETVRALEQEAQGPTTLIVYEQAGHGTDMLAVEPGLSDALLSFLVENLEP